MPSRVYAFGPLAARHVGELSRADLEFYGINHFRPSYHARVYLNEPDADAGTGTDSPGYAGHFSIFAHQGCFGDEGHCEVSDEVRRFDDRPSHPLTRAFKRVVVTDALRRVVPDGDEVSLTVVVTYDDAIDMEFDGEILDLTGIRLTLFA